MKNARAFDPLGLAISGMMFLGTSEPFMIPGGLMDQSSAIVFSHGILTALLARERQGIGQEIHISLYGTGIWLMYLNMMAANLLSVSPRDTDLKRFYQSPLRNIYRCKDGKWIIGVHHPEEPYWAPFCEATGKQELLNDSRFSDPEARQAHGPELMAIFNELFSTKTRDEWMEIMLAKGLIFCPVHDVLEIQNDRQALMNNYIVDFKDRDLGKIKIVGYPVSFSAHRAGTRSLAPRLGEHTDQIMRQLGYSDEELQGLKQEGVIK